MAPGQVLSRSCPSSLARERKAAVSITQSEDQGVILTSRLGLGDCKECVKMDVSGCSEWGGLDEDLLFSMFCDGNDGKEEVQYNSETE